MKQVWLLIATFFYTGLSPLAPGTCGSLATLLILYFVVPYSEVSIYIRLASILIVFLIGIPAGNHAEKHYNKKDPGQCVIDEVAGQMVTLLLAPHSIKIYILGFLLFRFFDIIKPFPIRKLEKIHGGLGIMIDDIAAGIYAFIILHAALYIFK